jgi:uncharacterized membrane protein YeaQ/YmgE (transglycosylase-associated protein family)
MFLFHTLFKNDLGKVVQLLLFKEEQMDITSLVLWLIIGAVAGWLAGNIMKGRGFGLVGNIVVGIIGSLIGGFLLGGLLSSLGLIGSLITAVVGAVLLLFVVGLFVKR